MKAVIQHLDSGVTELADLPAPGPRRGCLLIRTRASLVSAGTERMLVDFGRAGLIAKARSQPDKVRQVLDKVRTDGLLTTLDAVRAKLGQPLPLGYCNVGEVIAVGEGVEGFRVGDTVASNGPHAEIACVPANLCAKVPAGVAPEQAAFTVLGAIALQGIRLAQPTLGEAVAVAGLGLIGQLAVQLLRANGCRVLGLDPSPARCEVARRWGAETVVLGEGVDPVPAAVAFAHGRGIDAVLVTASAQSSEPIRQAAQMSRQRGRIVLVGVTGLELSRDDFYKKELSFQVSCSYGPGRYDAAYEEGGQDYPVGFVRWTVQRNFEAVLDQLACKALDPAPLLSHRFPFARAAEAYDLLTGGAPSLGILLEYPERPLAVLTGRTTTLAAPPAAAGKAVVGVIGAGGYASRFLLPALRDAGATLATVASSGGLTAAHAARRFGFATATTDTALVIGDAAIDSVVIATRHDSHAALTGRALAAGKHAFVEKPLAITRGQLDALEETWRGLAAKPVLLVGFNRRFAPLVVRMRALLAQVAGPKSLVMTVNAGEIPADHWTRDPAVGGGRIIGEGCHFVDLLRHLAGSPIVAVQAAGPGAGSIDEGSITLRFADGSLGTVHYITTGHRAVAKERLEVMAGGRVLQLDNFRRLRGHGWPGFRSAGGWRQDKGNAACTAAFIAAVRAGGPSPIPAEELFEVTRACFTAVEALRG